MKRAHLVVWFLSLGILCHAINFATTGLGHSLLIDAIRFIGAYSGLASLFLIFVYSVVVWSD